MFVKFLFFCSISIVIIIFYNQGQPPTKKRRLNALLKTEAEESESEYENCMKSPEVIACTLAVPVKTPLPYLNDLNEAINAFAERDGDYGHVAFVIFEYVFVHVVPDPTYLPNRGRNNCFRIVAANAGKYNCVSIANTKNGEWYKDNSTLFTSAEFYSRQRVYGYREQRSLNRDIPRAKKPPFGIYWKVKIVKIDKSAYLAFGCMTPKEVPDRCHNDHYERPLQYSSSVGVSFNDGGKELVLCDCSKQYDDLQCPDGDSWLHDGDTLVVFAFSGQFRVYINDRIITVLRNNRRLWGRGFITMWGNIQIKIE